MAVDLIANPSGARVQPLEAVRGLPMAEMEARIRDARRRLGDELLVLGHHYQKDEVIQFADLRGDSYGLSQRAAESRTARRIIFCGVHFMAETADMLTAPEVEVILPDLGAGCSMADMADIDQVEAAWEELGEALADPDAEVTPVTYINSTAALKGFCGRHGGIVCTSANAEQVLAWSFARRGKVLFFPDQHLGRNTAKRMGVPLDQMVVWDPRQPMGGNTAQAIRDAKVILWRGWCSVHQVFTTEHIAAFRQRDPAYRILVHPECKMEVVDQADLVGSTGYIIRQVRNAPPGSKWAIGTELHLVNRLRAEHPEQEIRFLSGMVCMCATMYRIDLPHLCWAIENLAAGTVVNRVQVPAAVREPSLTALARMLEVRGEG